MMLQQPRRKSNRSFDAIHPLVVTARCNHSGEGKRESESENDGNKRYIILYEENIQQYLGGLTLALNLGFASIGFEKRTMKNWIYP